MKSSMADVQPLRGIRYVSQTIGDLAEGITPPYDGISEEASATNLSQIMSLYDDPQGRMRKLLSAYADNPEIQITDEAREEHRLRAITDDQQIALIQDFSSERRLSIADGHHRYEPALNYRD